MSDPQDTIDPKEATEAKLCAYLEGELQPAERAEIEQHLLANPQHRQLLADLARTREWMRTIPAEHSPVDLAEIFQGQVERSMLLDDQRGASPGMMVRWPAFAMVAAVVVLMGGLSVLIYGMLKGPTAGVGPGKSYAIATGKAGPSTTLPSELKREFNSSMASARPVDLSTTPGVAPVPGTVSLASPSAEVSLPAVLPAQAPMLRDRSEHPELDLVKSKLTRIGYHWPIDHQTVCFVVSTDSINTAQEQVRGFFQRHQLAFEDATGGDATQPIALNKTLSVAGETPNALATPSTRPTDESIYVSHDLTSLQMELLAASLATETLNQSVQRFTLSAGPAVIAATSPIGAVSKGQVLTITVAQLVGPGIDKTNVVKVNDEGTISLPMIDPVMAVGLQPAELEQRIADKYRETNLIPAATVTVATATAPSTQTAVPTTLPATMPTTQGVVAATQKIAAPGGIEVVVIIDKNTGILPGK